MSERKYIHEFFDINHKSITLMSDRDLKEQEWEIQENKHNIEKLIEKCIAYDFLVKEADAKEDKLNLRDKS